MAKRKKKELDDLELKSLFNVADRKYIEMCAKLIPQWRVEYSTGAVIFVPIDQLDAAEQDLTVLHMQSRFKFQIQTEIGDYEPEIKPFNPELHERIKPVVPEVQQFVKEGDSFFIKKVEVTLKVVRIEGEMVYMQAVGQMANETPYGLYLIKDMVKRQFWERLY